jgi:hypothetical protein
VLCAGSTFLLVQSYALDEAPYTLSRAVAKLASINLLKFGSFSYWFDKPWFHTEGRLAAVLITPSLGVSNWAVIYKTPTSTPHHQEASVMMMATISSNNSFQQGARTEFLVPNHGFWW